MERGEHDERFIEKYKQGIINGFRIFVDTETGVNYLYTWNNSMAQGSGLTVLVDKDGKPVVDE